MGVTYKLRDEVVHFIISQRQVNPLFSCRQLAESASQKFGLHLSKSSVHDVLKESGIITPRGRKPKDKFKIPLDKKVQIQASLSQVKLLPASLPAAEIKLTQEEAKPVFSQKEDIKVSGEYEKAGEIFQKAILWDLGIFTDEKIKPSDWSYYLTYCKGIKVTLEGNKDFFIELPLPIERCIRETVDGLINNVTPMIIPKVSDEMLFKACMEAQKGFKIDNISIVDKNDHVILKLDNIMEYIRLFSLEKMIFVESYEIDLKKRLRKIFFPQDTDNNELIEQVSKLKGFDTTDKNENVVTLSVDYSFKHKMELEKAVEKINGMWLRDNQGRLLKLKIDSTN